MTSILYLCDGLSIHDRNFIESLSSVTSIEVLDIREICFSNPTEEILTRNPKMIIVTPIGALIDYVPENFSGALIGISLAFDLNEIHTEAARNIAIFRLNRLSGAIVDSEHTKRKLIQDFGYQGDVLKIVYGLRNPPVYGCRRLDYKLNRLLVTRTWTPLHNNELILETFLNVPPKYELSVAFLEPPEVYGQMSETRKLLLESAGVEFLKPMSNNDLQVSLLNYGVYVSASKSDGTSISLLEAMHAESICLVSDFPSNEEIITNEQNGFLFHNGSKESLLESIIKIQTLTLREARSIGSRAKLRVGELANWEQHSKALVEFCLSFEGKPK